MDATAPVASSRARLWLAAPFALSLLTADLAAIHIRRPLVLAEVESVLESRRRWSELVPVWHPQASDGVYLGLLKAWAHAGSSEWVARTPSVVAVACTAGLVYALGAQLFDRLTALAAGTLFATSSTTAGIGREVQPIALAMLAATLATWLFVVARRSRRPGHWVVYAIVAASSVYVHASCALVLVAHAAMLAFGSPPARRAVAATAITAALAAPAVVVVLAVHRHLIDPLRQPGLGDVARAVHDASGRNSVILAVAAIGLALLVYDAATGHGADALALLGAWTAAPLAAVLVLSIARPSLDARYLAVSTPAVSLPGGFGFGRLARREVAAAVGIAILALSGVRLSQLERRTAENWPAVVSYTVRSQQRGARIVIAPARAISAFAYYAGPGRGSLEPGGPAAFVVVRAGSEGAALDAARTSVRAPAYALRNELRFGRHLWVQEWDRTGLPPASG